ncbi:MAG TPA: DoxX family protein [Thermomicrobiales bacterium]|nr:DoxX family protein [Thermomicrobiales bacterium]
MSTVLSEARQQTPADAPRRAVGAALWAVQGLLALLFLAAGGMKLALPPAALAAVSPLPVAFLKFIGLVEVLGGLGLVLPALTRIRPGLTPLAAAGLALEMVGAVAATLAAGGGAAAAVPLAVGLLAALVAYGRGRG